MTRQAAQQAYALKRGDTRDQHYALKRLQEATTAELMVSTGIGRPVRKQGFAGLLGNLKERWSRASPFGREGGSR